MVTWGNAKPRPRAGSKSSDAVRMLLSLDLSARVKTTFVLCRRTFRPQILPRSGLARRFGPIALRDCPNGRRRRICCKYQAPAYTGRDGNRASGSANNPPRRRGKHDDHDRSRSGEPPVTRTGISYGGIICALRMNFRAESPRIYLWEYGTGLRWRLGPTGLPICVTRPTQPGLHGRSLGWWFASPGTNAHGFIHGIGYLPPHATERIIVRADLATRLLKNQNREELR
jgi:hypothetical protein